MTEAVANLATVATGTTTLPILTAMILSGTTTGTAPRVPKKRKATAEAKEPADYPSAFSSSLVVAVQEALNSKNTGKGGSDYDKGGDGVKPKKPAKRNWTDLVRRRRRRRRSEN